jgi:5-methylcytosine-specific restriction endonuclease McrA
MKLPKVPRKTTPAYGFSYLERSLKDCLRERRFGNDEQRLSVKFFREPTCRYCGNDNPTRWDHIVPIAKNVATVLGNMMLACSTCDNSKS